ncbi:hypothetical protein PoB_002094000 [Plakobranchus ocellatus]|uniref:Apple domain-containing protein n=1 Tax=Plakobranchus ocellatus TaxID=259542 RepID=A0AAV3ZIP9_9GAST|nr:hypothetical protein PoB_002094000 [Plakobranchus ocellatus]
MGGEPAASGTFIKRKIRYSYQEKLGGDFALGPSIKGREPAGSGAFIKKQTRYGYQNRGDGLRRTSPRGNRRSTWTKTQQTDKGYKGLWRSYRARGQRPFRRAMPIGVPSGRTKTEQADGVSGVPGGPTVHPGKDRADGIDHRGSKSGGEAPARAGRDSTPRLHFVKILRLFLQASILCVMPSSRWNPPSCKKLWRQLLALVIILLAVNVWSGSSIQAFNFHLIIPKQTSLNGILACKDLGYDGLAVINTPETFAYAVEFNKQLRSSGTAGINIGLTFRTGESHPTWNDGTDPVADLPWKQELASETQVTLYGRLNADDKVWLVTEEKKKHSLCGNHGGFRQMQGTTAHGQQPNNMTTTVHSASGLTYLGCIALCGKDINCRAAAFDTHYLTCRTFGPGNYSRLVPNPSVKTFVRVAF